MFFWNKSCGLALIFFIIRFSSNAQTTTPLTTFSYNFFKINNKEDASLQKPLSIISQNYYTQHFGIMCKQELAIEKATKIPFRFRLGSLQQCNYLEGKR